jgi:hypothetical protein
MLRLRSGANPYSGPPLVRCSCQFYCVAASVALRESRKTKSLQVKLVRSVMADLYANAILLREGAVYRGGWGKADQTRFVLNSSLIVSILEKCRSSFTAIWKKVKRPLRHLLFLPHGPKRPRMGWIYPYLIEIDTPDTYGAAPAGARTAV